MFLYKENCMKFEIIYDIHISLFMNFIALGSQTIHQRQMILTHRKIMAYIIMLHELLMYRYF